MATASVPHSTGPSSTGLRSFGPPDSDTYWSRRRDHQRLGEAPIHRRLAELVDRFAPPGEPLLSCGAGEGHVMRLCSTTRGVYGVELSADAIAAYDFTYQGVRQADLNDGIPNFELPSGEPIRFGAIVASWLLHWLDDPAGFLREAASRLTPGGVVIVNVPNITHYSYRLQMLAGRFPSISLSHRNFQTPREVEQTIAEAGLRVVRRMPAKPTLRGRLRPTLLARDIIYIARPPAADSTTQAV